MKYDQNFILKYCKFVAIHWNKSKKRMTIVKSWFLLIIELLLYKFCPQFISLVLTLSDRCLEFKFKKVVRVNLFQKRSFLHQLTHNMTTDCSLIYNFCPRKIQVQNMLCNNIVFVLVTCSEFFLYITHKSLNNLSSYCGLTDSRISASDTDLPVSITLEPGKI